MLYTELCNWSLCVNVSKQEKKVKRPVWKTQHRWGEKICLTVIGLRVWTGFNWIIKKYRGSLVITVMNIQISYKIRNLFTIIVAVSFSRRTMYDGVSQSVSTAQRYICTSVIDSLSCLNYMRRGLLQHDTQGRGRNLEFYCASMTV